MEQNFEAKLALLKVDLRRTLPLLRGKGKNDLLAEILRDQLSETCEILREKQLKR